MSFPSLVILDFSNYAERIRNAIRQISINERIDIGYLDYHYEHCLSRALNFQYDVKIVGYVNTRGFEVTTDLIYYRIYDDLLLPGLTQALFNAKIHLDSTVKIKLMTVGNAIVMSIEKDMHRV